MAAIAEQPVQLIVPFDPGSSTDVVARAMLKQAGSNSGAASAGAVHACKTARRRQSRPSRGL